MECPHYALRLDLDEVGLRFGGQVEIEVRGAPGGELRLNARDLEIGRVEVDGAFAEHTESPETEELILPGVGAGDHRLRIEFRGRVLEHGLIGLYRSAFGARSILTTMMFPNGARRVFPCFDAPALKAVFDLTLTVDAGSQVVFNTRPKSSETQDGRKKIVFEPTPLMSTYLVYLGVGPVAFLEGQSHGTTISVALPPGRERAGQFALEHAGRALGGFAEYFRIPYPLPKLHLVCVPDFWAGAQENWGAIAFLETRLLVDATSSARLRRRARETITHEIAHQWFGNLVTNRAWDDFWLNEGFATLMQAKMDALLYPELDLWSDYFLTFVRWGMTGDILWSTHPVAVPVRRPEELGELVDEITYGKGSGVLRMVDAYLGEEVFRAGVTRYLERFAYRSTRGRDLWQALEETAEEPVTKIMEAWISTPGHPTVSVAREGDRLRFRQRRSSLDGRTDDTTWPVPVTYTANGAPGRLLLTGPAAEVPSTPHAVVRVNPGRTGFYRVRYEGELDREVRAAFGELPDVDRWGLLLDGFGFLLAGEVALEEYLDLLERAAAHPAPLTAGEVVGDFDEVRPMLTEIPRLRDGFRDYFRRSFEAVGSTPRAGEAESVAGMRGMLALARARSDEEFAASLAHRFAAFDSVPGDLRTATAAAFGMRSGPRAVEELTERMLAAPSEEYAGFMVTGLAHLRGPGPVEEALGLVLDPHLPVARSAQLLLGLCASPSEPDPLWGWLAEHLPEVDRLLAGTPLLACVLETGIPALGVSRSGAVRSYFEAPRFPAARQGIRKGLERLEVHLRFLERHSDRRARGSAR
jgi:tricorn protease interacting factor F2/3